VKRLKELAFKDELTELYNRRGFKEEAFKFIKEVVASKKFKSKRESVFINNFSLVVFDIDNFKKLNDTYGHDAGDMALKQLAKVVSERVRTIDAVARWGGEEFVVGLVGASENDAYVIAEDIREKLAKTKINWRGKKFSFTVSGGAASLSEVKDFEPVRSRPPRQKAGRATAALGRPASNGLDSLFHAADKALYKAKRSGKNKIVRFSDL